MLATQRPDSKTIPSGLRAVLGSRFALRVMDWRDSNIVLGEQMNTRGYDSSGCSPRTRAWASCGRTARRSRRRCAGADGADVLHAERGLADDLRAWPRRCGRRLGRSPGTRPGRTPTPVLDHAAAVKAIGAGHAVDAVQSPGRAAGAVGVGGRVPRRRPGERREFVPTAELVEALWRSRRTTFAQQMTELGCRPTRGRVPGEDGETRRVRGYLTAEIRSAVDRATAGTGPATRTISDEPVVRRSADPGYPTCGLPELTPARRACASCHTGRADRGAGPGRSGGGGGP